MDTQANNHPDEKANPHPSILSRLKSERGASGLSSLSSIIDAMRSLATALIRVGCGRLLHLPWLTYPAIRFLSSTVTAEFKVFEFGGGMSTGWLNERCAEVHTAESNREWLEILRRQTRRANLYHLAGCAYPEKIAEFGAQYFDLVVIDGEQRLQCFIAAESRIRTGGYLVIDDSDMGQLRLPSQISKDGREIDRILNAQGAKGKYRVTRFTGWIPGSFYVKETTVCQRLK
jgi:hypothetical protein